MSSFRKQFEGYRWPITRRNDSDIPAYPPKNDGVVKYRLVKCPKCGAIANYLAKDGSGLYYCMECELQFDESGKLFVLSDTGTLVSIEEVEDMKNGTMTQLRQKLPREVLKKMLEEGMTNKQIVKKVGIGSIPAISLLRKEYGLAGERFKTWNHGHALDSIEPSSEPAVDLGTPDPQDLAEEFESVTSTCLACGGECTCNEEDPEELTEDVETETLDGEKYVLFLDDGSDDVIICHDQAETLEEIERIFLETGIKPYLLKTIPYELKFKGVEVILNQK